MREKPKQISVQKNLAKFLAIAGFSLLSNVTIPNMAQANIGSVNTAPKSELLARGIDAGELSPEETQQLLDQYGVTYTSTLQAKFHGHPEYGDTLIRVLHNDPTALAEIADHPELGIYTDTSSTVPNTFGLAAASDLTVYRIFDGIQTLDGQPAYVSIAATFVNKTDNTYSMSLESTGEVDFTVQATIEYLNSNGEVVGSLTFDPNTTAVVPQSVLDYAKTARVYPRISYEIIPLPITLPSN